MTSTPKNWRDAAACLAEDAELFYPVGETGPALLQIEEARAVCTSCPVQSACLETALALEGGTGPESRHGIWAGLTGRERYAIYSNRCRRARNRQQAAA